MEKKEMPNLEFMLIVLNSKAPGIIREALTSHYKDCYRDNEQLLLLNEYAIKMYLIKLSGIIIEILDKRTFENQEGEFAWKL